MVKKYNIEELVRLLKIGFYLNVKLVYRMYKLKKALDKACEELHCGQDENDDRNFYSKDQWKEWCMNDD